MSKTVTPLQLMKESEYLNKLIANRSGSSPPFQIRCVYFERIIHASLIRSFTQCPGPAAGEACRAVRCAT
eukprot:7291430-Prymnesium_polylepis.1